MKSQRIYWKKQRKVRLILANQPNRSCYKNEHFFFFINNKDNTQSNKDNDPCDAFECNFRATNKIDLDCGDYGTLTIFVCKKCVGKFRTGGQ